MNVSELAAQLAQLERDGKGDLPVQTQIGEEVLEVHYTDRHAVGTEPPGLVFLMTWLGED